MKRLTICKTLQNPDTFHSLGALFWLLRPISAINSDRSKLVSGSDDHSILVWDKHTSQLLEELKGHEGPVSCVRMLSVERVLSASHDGTVKMWDVRTDTCVATICSCSNAVLCMQYDDSTGILAAAGRDVAANIWDIRAGRQMHKLVGHTKWIRPLRMVGDTVLTGSDDWSARVWSLSRGTETVLAYHAGPVMCVEYSPSDKGVITGSTDGLVKFWENNGVGMRCTKNVTLHASAILSIDAGDHWVGIGAADNSMSLFHRPQERLGGFSNTGSKLTGWQLYRTPEKTIAMATLCIYSCHALFRHDVLLLISTKREYVAVAAMDFFSSGKPPSIFRLYTSCVIMRNYFVEE